MAEVLTPVEYKKVFNKGFRGYVEQEVDEFIEKLGCIMNVFIREYGDEDLIADLNDKLNQYKILRKPLKIH